MSRPRRRVRLALLPVVISALAVCLAVYLAVYSGPPRGLSALGLGAVRPDAAGPSRPALDPVRSDLARGPATHTVGDSERPAVKPAPTSPPPVIGIVVDAAGRGIVGAEVRAYHDLRAGFDVPFDVSKAAENALAATTTGPEGRFELSLGAWSYVRIVAEAEGFVRARADAVRPGDSLEITLHPAASLTVRVLDAVSLAPLSGVEVRVRHGAGCGLSARATSDALGRVTFPSLTPGLATYEPWTATFARVWPADVTLAPGEASDVELRLASGTEVRGVVRDRATGHTLAGAQVSAQWGLSPAVFTDAAGSFRLSVVPDRPGTVIATAPGYGRGEVRYKDPRELVELSLLSGVTVLGQVVGPHGEGLASADVGVFGSPDANWSDRREQRTGKVDGSGRFVVTDIRRDLPVVLRLRAPGHGAVVVALDVASAVAGVLDVGVLSLEQEALIYGRVLDGDGAPVSELNLELVSTTWADKFGEDAHWVALRSVMTDAAGRFRFAELAAGDWTIRGDLLDVSDRRNVQRVKAGASVGEVVLRVPTLHKVRGSVLDEETGAGVGGALVVLWPRDPAVGTPTLAIADEQGRFVLRTPRSFEFDVQASRSEVATDRSQPTYPVYEHKREGPFTLAHGFVELRLKRSER